MTNSLSLGCDGKGAIRYVEYVLFHIMSLAALKAESPSKVLVTTPTNNLMTKEGTRAMRREAMRSRRENMREEARRRLEGFGSVNCGERKLKI